MIYPSCVSTEISYIVDSRYICCYRVGLDMNDGSIGDWLAAADAVVVVYRFGPNSHNSRPLGTSPYVPSYTSEKNFTNGFGSSPASALMKICCGHAALSSAS